MCKRYWNLNGIAAHNFSKLFFNIWGVNKLLPPTYKRQVWDHKKANAECIRRSISSVDGKFLFQETSVNQKVMIFNKLLMNNFHSFIPNKIINCSYKWPPG